MNAFLPIGQCFVFHHTFRNREKGVISANLDVQAGFDLRAALANQDVTGKHFLPGEFLDAKALCVAIAAVTTGTTTFLCAMIFTPLLLFR